MKSGIGALLLIVGMILLVGVVIPYAVGYAVTWLVHVLLDKPWIVSHWIRWLIGIAIVFVASLFSTRIRTND